MVGFKKLLKYFWHTELIKKGYNFSGSLLKILSSSAVYRLDFSAYTEVSQIVSAIDAVDMCFFIEVLHKLLTWNSNFFRNGTIPPNHGLSKESHSTLQLQSMNFELQSIKLYREFQVWDMVHWLLHFENCVTRVWISSNFVDQTGRDRARL